MESVDRAAWPMGLDASLGRNEKGSVGGGHCLLVDGLLTSKCMGGIASWDES